MSNNTETSQRIGNTNETGDLGTRGVRVIRPYLLFCIHQRNSEGVGRGEGKCRRLSRSKGVVG